MLKYLVTADRAVKVDGLGVFEEGETRELSEDQAVWWSQLTGTPLITANVPDGVEITVEVEGE